MSAIQTELTVKIASGGAGQTVRDVLGVQKAISQLGKDAKDTAALAKALGTAFNLPDDQVRDLADALGQAKKEADGLATTSKGLNSIFQGIFQGVGQQLTQVGFAALNTTLSTVGNTIKSAIGEFERFELALVSFDAKSTASQEQIKAIGDQAKELAAVTSQSPAGVAELATALLTLGATADDVEKNLKGITFLADVLGEDPVLTGQVVQTGINIFGEFGETADSLSDKLNFLINNTAAGATGGLSEFFQLFADVGGIVGATGASFDELAATFAVLRNGGASASIAATGIKTALLALSAPTSAANEDLKKLGISAFDADGNFRGFEQVLLDASEALKTASQQEQIQFAEKVFGREGAPAFLTALKEANGSLGELIQGLKTDADGSLAESLETINGALIRQVGILEGSIDSGLTDLGEALAPAKLAAVQFANELVAASIAGSAGLGALTAAGERLRTVLADNPELVEAIASALARVGDIITSSVASALNALADQIGTLSREGLQELADRFVETVQTVVGLASAIGEVALVFGELAAGVGGGAVDAFNDLAPALEAVVQFLGAVLAAVTPLVSNTELVSLAMQTLLIRMVAIQGLAFAATLKTIGAAMIAGLQIPAIAAATGLGGLEVALVAVSAKLATFLTAAAAAAAPVAILAAGIGAIKFIRFTKDMGDSQEALEAYIGSIDAAAVQGISFANKLNNINDAIAGAGGKATADQLRKLEEFKRLSQAQVEDLKRQLSEVESIEPKGDAQKQAQQNLISQLNSTITALNGQITEAEGTLAGAASGAGEKTGEAFNEGLKESVSTEPKEVIEDALKGLGDATKAALADLQTTAANARAAILEAGGDPAKLAALEAKSLRDRMQTNRDFLKELEALQSGGGLSAEDAAAVADQIRQVDGQLASDRVSLAQQTLAEKKRIEKEAADAAKKAADEARKAAEAKAKAETDALKKVRDEEKRIADQRQADAERLAQREFGDARDGRTEAREAQRREEDKAAQKALQESDRAYQEQRRQSDKVAQEQAQAKADAFQKSQQAAAEAFQKRLDAERDKGNREFDVLTSEVERRIQLQQAADAESRKELRAQFAEEDKQLTKRRQVEREVLAERGKVLSDRREETTLGPLEQARADFEERLQAKAAAFQEGQQAQAQAFQEQQAAEAEARAEALRLEDEARADERAAAEDARAEARRAEDKAFEELERQLQDDFEAQQRSQKEAFNAQQRQLDEASAQRIAAILAAAKPAGIDGARKDGGPVRGGGTYLVGEEGPELVTMRRGGYVHTARETAAMMAGVSGRGAAVTVAQPSTGAVEAKLDRLISVVEAGRRVQAGPTSFVLQSEAPVQDAIAIQLEQLRQMVRGGGL